MGRVICRGFVVIEPEGEVTLFLETEGDRFCRVGNGGAPARDIESRDGVVTDRSISTRALVWPFMLPSFLQPLSGYTQDTAFIHSIFQHSKAFGSSKTLWWPNADPKIIILFIPGMFPWDLMDLLSLSPYIGNPGLAEFYIPFLSTLYNSSNHCSILAQSHLGHTEEAPAVETNLAAQVTVTIEAFDVLKQTYPGAKILIIGHSVGSYIALQVS